MLCLRSASVQQVDGDHAFKARYSPPQGAPMPKSTTPDDRVFRRGLLPMLSAARQTDLRVTTPVAPVIQQEGELADGFGVKLSLPCTWRGLVSKWPPFRTATAPNGCAWRQSLGGAARLDGGKPANRVRE